MTLDREIDLEQEMRKRGRDKARAAGEKAAGKGVRGAIGGGSVLVREAVWPLGDALRAWMKARKVGRPGPRPEAYRLLDGVDLDKAAFIGVLTVVNSLSLASERPMRLTTIANRIGGRIEDEERWDAFQHDRPHLYRWWIEELRRRHAKNYDFQRQVLRTAMKRTNTDWTEWTTPDKVHVGMLILDLLARPDIGIGLVEVELDKSRLRSSTHVVRLADRYVEQMRKGDDRLARPAYMPTLVPPKPWTNPRDGGYFALRLSLVKRGFRHKSYRDELAAASMPEVYSALNAVQETAWRINRDVFEVAEYILENGIPGCSLAKADEILACQYNEDVPAKPPGISGLELEAFKKRLREIKRVNAQRNSAKLRAVLTLGAAREYQNADSFWFPCELDFRGRMYASPIHLTPQGADLAKGLLEFADAKPLGEKGVEWLAIHVANCSGAKVTFPDGRRVSVDKLGLEDRITWTGAHEERIRATAADPLSDWWWAFEDEAKTQPRADAWRFLAACLDYAAACEYEGGMEAYPSRLPVAMDGTCNGLQNFAAMMRDEVGGAAVNLVPSETPADVYAAVLDRLIARVQELTQSEDPTDRSMAHAWIGSGFLKRDLVKRPVMTSPYSVTLYGMKGQIEDDLVKPAIRNGHPGFQGPDGTIKPDYAVRWLTPLLWHAVGEIIVTAREAMSWLQACAEKVSAMGLPIYWTTPLGFPVRQYYPRLVKKRIKTRLLGQVIQLDILVETPEIDAKRQGAGIAPNFVHSYDATHLMMTVNRCVARGLDAFGMVHDSYATHAADCAVMAEELRLAFVDLYADRDAFAAFARDLPGGVDVPPQPATGMLDVRQVVDSAYFFA